MSLEEYASGLVSIATGWLGWTFDEAMKADCLAIRIAYEGRADMFRAIFGGEPEQAKPTPKNLPVMTPGFFRAMFDRAA